MSASEFKQQCLSLLDEVGPEGIVITKHGKAVAKLVPLARDSAHLIGALKGRLTIQGDILLTGADWDAAEGISANDGARRRSSKQAAAKGRRHGARRAAIASGTAQRERRPGGRRG